MAKIIIGTTNPGKIREIAAILSPLGHEIAPIALDVDETGKTIAENAKLKAAAYCAANPGDYVIVEDSGLVCPSIVSQNGAQLPGPYSARFHSLDISVSEVNAEGIMTINVNSVPHEDFTTDKTEHDKLNNERLISLIKDIPFEKRAAYFEVDFIIAKDGEILNECNGKSYGYINDELKGSNGFGYDPLFIGNDTFGKTYAELDSARKNLKSHRKKALKELGLWIATNISA